ncbi:hypothetical protein [Polyangium jinanense]|uniref:Uncharacterized protein n=1 Tax=Polyangium jinanense TaxID=2829994 RepID=A0A9X3X3W8_9BACT|nr:hypothetical protein [Polyangium jinanense]MDC3959922.1 hypothetical protein [Polyangium jinanense]MDC3983802.1 hypothetical protein [Polyangium jinanense]
MLLVSGYCLAARPEDYTPSIVFALRHSVTQVNIFGGPKENVSSLFGGDRGARSGEGYSWYSFRDRPSDQPSGFKLPPGVVFGLTHSAHMNPSAVTVFGKNPYRDREAPAGFTREFGGDLEAPAGQGYYWYESTGKDFSDWSNLQKLLPRWTVVGLKHTQNQPWKKLTWDNKTYDPAMLSEAPPLGFSRQCGGDLGASGGHGFCWYEKMTGVDFVSERSCGSLGQGPCLEAGPVTCRWGHCRQDHTLTCKPGLDLYNKSTCVPRWIDVLDVWGEGRIVTSGLVTGFDEAYNINWFNKTISNGPARGENIPRLLPIEDYDRPRFLVFNDSVKYITVMGAPITAATAEEMYRVIDKSRGMVILYDPCPVARKNFEDHMGRMRRKNVDISELSPFNQIRIDGDVYVYDFSGHEDL